MHTSHIKPDDIAAPIDIRLVPAAGLTAAVCYVGPQLSPSWSYRMGIILVLVGIVAVILIACYRRRNNFVHGVLIIAIAALSFFFLPSLEGTHPVMGDRRADGSVMTASLPESAFGDAVPAQD